MQIKSTVLQEGSTEKNGGDPSPDLEGIKEAILGECRQMIIEILREQGER